MYKTPLETAGYIEEFLVALGDESEVEVVLVPPFTSLETAASMLRGTCVALGAQNMNAAEEGAFTGEVSARMLVEVGCSHVVIGHSERRQYFAETDAGVCEKTRKALEESLTPIVCVGELLSERQAGQTRAVLERQTTEGLAKVPKALANRVVVAYEPVWAIGTGINATKEDAQDGIRFIREVLIRIFGADKAMAIRILYGGSVKSFNIAEYMAQPDIDGALVGGASLEPAAFLKIVRFRDQG